MSITPREYAKIVSLADKSIGLHSYLSEDSSLDDEAAATESWLDLLNYLVSLIEEE